MYRELVLYHMRHKSREFPKLLVDRGAASIHRLTEPRVPCYCPALLHNNVGMPVKDESEDSHLLHKLGDLSFLLAELITRALARLRPDSMDPCLV